MKEDIIADTRATANGEYATRGKPWKLLERDVNVNDLYHAFEVKLKPSSYYTTPPYNKHNSWLAFKLIQTPD